MVVTSQEELANIVQIMEFGADDFMVKPLEKNAFKTRVEILLKKKENANRRFEAPPQTLACDTINDKLSGLYSRDYFDQQLNNEIRRSLRQRYPLTLMIIHIDVLEMDDDSFGDLTRGQIINHYGQVIKRCLRGEDFAAFFSDKTYAALLPFLDKSDAGSIVSRIQKAVSDHNVLPQESSDRPAATASLGFACCPADACTAEQLTQRAIAALHKAPKK